MIIYVNQHLLYGTTLKNVSVGEFFINPLVVFINSIRETMTTSTAILYSVFGMFIFSEILLFAGFIWGYLHSRWSNLIMPSELNIEAYLQITDTLNIGSSLVSVLLQKIQESKSCEYDLYIENLVLIGLLFLSFQNDEYSFMLTTLNSYWLTMYFYILTGLHSLHVCVGVIMALANSFLYEGDGSNLDEDFNIGVYWHFVEMIWIALTILLFLN
uniref:Cytochrome c oxidase subunit 3 n=1 Tax=Cytauxzoon felis TaxID=27996 RepID=W8CJS8_9APIC|nr:cytochrome c oxidase subunit 3 [Cytauxzoon felis]